MSSDAVTASASQVGAASPASNDLSESAAGTGITLHQVSGSLAVSITASADGVDPASVADDSTFTTGFCEALVASVTNSSAADVDAPPDCEIVSVV